MGESDLVHLGCHTWEIAETSILWRVRFILLIFRIEIDSGWVDIDIMEMLGRDKLGLHRYPTTRFWEGRIQSELDGRFFIVRAVQHQHGGTLLRLAWDPSITIFSGSSTLRDELLSTGGDHSDNPFQSGDLLLIWGSSLVWKDVQQ